MRPLTRLSAGLLACAALAPRAAIAGQLYDLSLTSERGSISEAGTSLGAFTETPTFFAFYGQDNAGTYPSDIFVSPTLLDPTAVSTTTLNYTSGTGGGAYQPITAALSLPDPDNVETPYFYTMTGSILLTGTLTNTGTGSTFNFLMEFMDPENDTLLDKLQVSGIVTVGGAADGIDSWAGSFVFESGINETEYTTIITGKQLGDATLVPEPASAPVLGAGLVALLFSRRRLRISGLTV